VLNVDDVNTDKWTRRKRSSWYVTLSCLDSWNQPAVSIDEQSETLKYLYLLFSDDTVLPLDSMFLFACSWLW
jgi:hypothetical protein